MCVHKRQKMVGEGGKCVWNTPKIIILKKINVFTFVVKNYKTLKQFYIFKTLSSLNVNVTLCW